MPVSEDFLSASGRIVLGFVNAAGPFPSGSDVSIHTAEQTYVVPVHHWDIPRSAPWVDAWIQKHSLCRVGLVLDSEPLRGVDLSQALVDESTEDAGRPSSSMGT